MDSLKSKPGLRLALIGLCATLGLAAGPVAAQPKDAGNATDAVNPYSPRNGHAYRHGVVPTRETHEQMRAWAATHRPMLPSVAAGKASAAAAAATGTQTLSYNGGVDGIGVTSGTPRVYLVFWGSQWGTAGTDANGYVTLSGDAKGAAPYMQKWIKGLGTSGELWSGVMTQYCDGPLVAKGATSCPAGAPHVGYPTGGGVLAGVWYDNSAAAPSAATGHQIGAEAVKAAAHFGNNTAASNRYVQYVIMSPTGTKPDGFNTPNGGFCAWHDYTGDTTLSGGAVTSTAGDIAFTNMPYVTDMGTSCGQSSVSSVLDGFSIVGGHEYAETVTDQNPAGGWINQTGSSYNGQENGDECAWISSGQGATALVAMSTGSFAMQSSWSNDTNRCDLSHAIVTGSGGTPSANFTFTTSGLTANFTDTSTDAGGSIGSRSWTFGDGGTATTATPSHTYAAAGTYNVTETVTDSGNGSTSSKTLAVTVSTAGGTPVANFSVATSGLTATFTDSSTDTGGTIASHSWTFGDGATSTATSPSHTYAAAGSYSVSETVTDAVSGTTSSKTVTLTVTTGGGTPSANFSFTTSGLTANFTDTSTDSGGTIGSHSWTFGDGGTSTAANASHTYAAAGTYSVTETVTDSANGSSSSKTSSVSVTGGGGGSTQLLGNTGFETGSAAPWSMTSGVLCSNSSCGGETAHAGSWFAWLDGYGTTHTDTVSQSVTIPSGKTTATLQFYLHIDTAETTTTTAYDTLKVQVLNSSGTVLATLATFSNLNAASGYTVHTANMSAYIGQTVTIKFTGSEDASLQTSFVLDDVTLTAQ